MTPQELIDKLKTVKGPWATDAIKTVQNLIEQTGDLYIVDLASAEDHDPEAALWAIWETIPDAYMFGHTKLGQKLKLIECAGARMGDRFFDRDTGQAYEIAYFARVGGYSDSVRAVLKTSNTHANITWLLSLERQ